MKSKQKRTEKPITLIQKTGVRSQESERALKSKLPEAGRGGELGVSPWRRESGTSRAGPLPWARHLTSLITRHLQNVLKVRLSRVPSSVLNKFSSKLIPGCKANLKRRGQNKQTTKISTQRHVLKLTVKPAVNTLLPGNKKGGLQDPPGFHDPPRGQGGK